MATFVQTSGAIEQLLSTLFLIRRRGPSSVAALLAFEHTINSGRGILTTPAAASRLTHSLKPNPAAERELCQTFCSIPAIIAEQIPFLLKAENPCSVSRQAIFFLACELDFALDIALARAEAVRSQSTTAEKILAMTERQATKSVVPNSRHPQKSGRSSRPPRGHRSCRHREQARQADVDINGACRRERTGIGNRAIHRRVAALHEQPPCSERYHSDYWLCRRVCCFRCT